MNKRLNELSQLQSFIENNDKEVTMILQALQWDRKRLLKGHSMEKCKYNPNHRIPPDKKESHEEKCQLIFQGYSDNDKILPEPVDTNANTLIKLKTEDIFKIINDASELDLTFKKGGSGHGSEPWTLDRLQTTYTSDERRAIHDAVVRAVPSCHDLADLALPSVDAGEKDKTKSRMEILAELRNMKRRRTKYRVATKARNYSVVLRDVIKTQMELFTDTLNALKPAVTVKTEPADAPHKNIKNERQQRDNSADPRNRETQHKERKEKKYTSKNEHDDRYYRDYERGHHSSSTSKYKSNENKYDKRDQHYRSDKHRSDSREGKRHHDVFDRDEKSYARRTKDRNSSKRNFKEENHRYYDYKKEDAYEDKRKRKRHS